MAAHVHDRGVTCKVGQSVNAEKSMCLPGTRSKLSTIRPTPTNHLGGVATDPIAEPFDHHIERIGHRGVHSRYPRKLADGIRNAFGKFCLHKLRELTHNVAVVIELDGAGLNNLIAQPTALALLWHRRKLKSSTIWRAKFVVSIADTASFQLTRLGPFSVACRLLHRRLPRAVRIGARTDMKVGRNTMRQAHAMQTAPESCPLYSNA